MAWSGDTSAGSCGATAGRSERFGRRASAAGHGRDEHDLRAVGERCGPGGEFTIDGHAQALGREGEAVALAEFLVKLPGGGGLGLELFAAQAALLAEKREVLEVDGFHGGLGGGEFG